MAFTLANLAMARLTETEGLNEVVSWLGEARNLVDRVADPPMQGWVACMESRALTRKGKPAEALAWLDLNLTNPREAIHPDGRAWALVCQGEAHQAVGDNLPARGRFEEALAVWRSLESPWGVVHALICLANVRSAGGDLDVAMSFYQEALDISERFGLDGCSRQCRAAVEE